MITDRDKAIQVFKRMVDDPEVMWINGCTDNAKWLVIRMLADKVRQLQKEARAVHAEEGK